MQKQQRQIISEQMVLETSGTEQISKAPLALSSLSLSALLPTLNISGIHIALPTLATVFDATFQQVQWIALAYLLVITAFSVSIGRLSDTIGRKRLLLGVV